MHPMEINMPPKVIDMHPRVMNMPPKVDYHAP